MSLPDADIKDLLMDDDPPSGIGSGWPAKIAPAAADERPPKMKEVSETIGQRIDDIATGRAAGEYPAMDKLIGPEANRPHWPDGICTPECPNRRHHATEERVGPPIVDVHPSVPERVYGLERDIAHIRHEFKEHRNESVRASGTYSSKEEVAELRYELRNSVQALANGIEKTNKRMDRRVILVVIQAAALLVTSAYGLILSYKHFIEG